ncbi:MAG: HIT family protein [Candidatus Micrarchaeaceae archaeon]
MSQDCIFCRIIRKEEQAYIIYEDRSVIAILDKAPFTEGHTLIITKTHSTNLLDADNRELSRAILIAKKLALFYSKELKCDGVNLLHATGAVAGQSVNHFHMHVVPRYKSDGIGNPWYRTRKKSTRNSAVYARLVASKYYGLLGVSNSAKARMQTSQTA